MPEKTLTLNLCLYCHNGSTVKVRTRERTLPSGTFTPWKAAWIILCRFHQQLWLSPLSHNCFSQSYLVVLCLPTFWVIFFLLGLTQLSVPSGKCVANRVTVHFFAFLRTDSQIDFQLLFALRMSLSCWFRRACDLFLLGWRAFCLPTFSCWTDNKWFQDTALLSFEEAAAPQIDV